MKNSITKFEDSEESIASRMDQVRHEIDYKAKNI